MVRLAQLKHLVLICLLPCLLHQYRHIYSMGSSSSRSSSVKAKITLFNHRAPNEGLSVLLEHESRGTEIDLLVDALDLNYPFYITIHGFRVGGENDWAHELKDELLGVVTANVLIVDWSISTSMNESLDESISRAKTVADLIARFFNRMNLKKTSLKNSKKRYFIGHSIGARIADFAIMQMHNKETHLIALDPNSKIWLAKPRNAPNIDQDLLSFRSYATVGYSRYTTVLHTDIRRLGIPVNFGTADVYINGGFEQPGCEGVQEDADKALKTNCNHKFATKLFRSISRHSLARENNANSAELEKLFQEEFNKCFPVAYLCESHVTFLSGMCGICERRYIGLGVKSYCFHVGWPAPEENYNLLANYDGSSPIHTLKTDVDGSCLYTYRIIVGILERHSAYPDTILDERAFIRLALSDHPSNTRTVELSRRFRNIAMQRKSNNELRDQLMISRGLYKLTGGSRDKGELLRSSDLHYRSILLTFKSKPSLSVEPPNEALERPLKLIRFIDVWGKNISRVAFVAVDYMSHPDSRARTMHSFFFTRNALTTERKRKDWPIFDYFATFSIQR